MKKEVKVKWNVGTSSVILVIVVFALAVFAVLSVKASNSDLVLAKKTREAMQSYYKADTEAERLLMQIDQILKNYYDDLSGLALKVQLQERIGDMGKVVAKTDKIGEITYQIPINKYAELEVALRYDIEPDREKYYDVTKWAVNQKEIGEYDFSNFTYWSESVKGE